MSVTFFYLCLPRHKIGLKDRLWLVTQGQSLTKFVSRTIASELKENSVKVDQGNFYFGDILFLVLG